MSYIMGSPEPHHQQRWCLMEQFEQIALTQPVSPSNLISKSDTHRLHLANLVKNTREGYCLTLRGKVLWIQWNRIK